MSLLKNVCVPVLFSAALSACTSAVFPDVIEDEQASVSGRITAEDSQAAAGKSKIVHQMPKEGSVLTGDKQNVSYEDDEEVKPLANKAEEVLEDKPVAAKTVPVVKEDAPKKAEAEKVEEKAPSMDVLNEEEVQPSISYRAETIYFENGSAVVDASYNASLRRIVKEAKANNAKVRVLGYASSRTRNTDAVTHKLANFKISSERAQNVANALRRAGLKADMIEVEALSDSAPVYQEVMPEGERLNRRAEIYIAY